MAKPKQIIAMSAPVSISAGESDGEGKQGPATFVTTFYTGGAISVEGWDLPLVVDLSGLTTGKVLVANLDHDRTKRVGNFELVNDGAQLIAQGKATAATAARDEVVNSALDGYQWQSSLEVNPTKIATLAKGKTREVNGQTITGPAYIVQGTLKGFGFVSHGADDNTSVTIAAIAASTQETTKMKPEVKAWAESMGIDCDNVSDEQAATIEANYNGKNGKKTAAKSSSDPFEARRIEARRQADIREIADKFIERRPHDIEFINACEKMVDHAIDAKMEARDFRAEMYEQSVPLAHTVPSPRGGKSGFNTRVLEASICEGARLGNLDKHYTDQELQAAHDMYPEGIGLNELVLACAEHRGYRGRSTRATVEAQQIAFGKGGNIQAQGWSTIEISSILSNVANKFIKDGWNTVDMTAMRLAYVKPVRDFKQTTTVSLWGDTEFEKLGAAGEIKHGTLGEVVYTGKADTYAKMLAITRQDYINDDLGALTGAPRKLGRGGALKFNDLFWTALLGGETAGFFSATHTDAGNTGNSNLNTGAADATLAGLTATELLFMNQVGPDGKPAGVEPAIVLVPTALKATMAALLDPQSRFTGGTTTVNAVNVFAGRFRLESSPYMHNTSYTGYSSAAWYMMADPNVMATIEVQALFGRVEPVIESADTDFNTLGIQMRGYSDIGCSRQEFRACVKADGGSS